MVSDYIVQRLYHGSCSGGVVFWCVFFAGGGRCGFQRRPAKVSRIAMGDCFKGALTARNCLRELCCELVSAIVYAVVVVYGCVYCSRTVLYIYPAGRIDAEYSRLSVQWRVSIIGR